ncbi:MAG: hypothetical protein IT323_16230 [Anaerolineae bacterium]|nr:hypothetical protein [Anaerolineae bacterium]
MVAPDQLELDNRWLTRKTFLEGPAGAGKTTLAARFLLRLLEVGVAPDRILVLVPQVTLGRPYEQALRDTPGEAATVHAMTIAGLARQAVEFYWPLVAEPLGFADPAKEPTFLNVETAQYFMARFAVPMAAEGHFQSVRIAPPRIVSQVLDNLNRAALMRFPIDEVANRLSAAWGDERDSARIPVYQTAVDIAQAFRAHCLQHNLLDFSLIMEAFLSHVMPNERFQADLRGQFDYLIADNLEEDSPVAHDLIDWLLPGLRAALLVFDSEGGYRTLLGADPENALGLSTRCDEVVRLDGSHVMSPPLEALAARFDRVLGPVYKPPPENADDDDLGAAFELTFHRFFPQMVDWTAAEIVKLVRDGAPPNQIAVLAPSVSDSLRFTLSYRLKAYAEQAGIDVPLLSHRPSRALHDEPSTRAMLTLAALAHPEWGERPPGDDVADALAQSVAELDPARARLLAGIVYRERGGAPSMSPFARIHPEMQERVSFRLGERFDLLREWLESYKAEREHDGPAPLDHFWRRLFGEVLAQPGFGFHENLEAGRVVAQLIESAQRFRAALYPGLDQDWLAAGREYVALTHQRLLPALFAQNWDDELTGAVFLAPTSTFLLRNRFVDYQFWLDAGGGMWAQRLEQPLTHPYVLRRDYPPDRVWTDEMEADAERMALYRVVIGLLRRCRKKLALGIADLGESGFEQRGMLLHVLQQVMRRPIAGVDPALAADETPVDDEEDEG